MNKIKKISGFFRILFQICFVALPIIVILFWLQAPTPLSFGLSGASISFIPNPSKILHTLSTNEKYIGFLISLLPLSIHLWILSLLIGLFGQYAHGHVFTINNTKRIKNIGIAILISQIIGVIHEGLMSFAMSWHNLPGHRYVTVTIGGVNIGLILAALMVILIAWVMGEACKLKDNYSRIV